MVVTALLANRAFPSELELLLYTMVFLEMPWGGVNMTDSRHMIKEKHVLISSHFNLNFNINS